MRRVILYLGVELIESSVGCVVICFLQGAVFCLLRVRLIGDAPLPQVLAVGWSRNDERQNSDGVGVLTYPPSSHFGDNPRFHCIATPVRYSFHLLVPPIRRDPYQRRSGRAG